MNLSKTNIEKKDIQSQIEEQLVEEGIKNLDKIKPIDHGIMAYAHTPVYKIHRYFARRPYSVFNGLIKHYSNAGNIVLDPFCGGGVTIVEGLRLRRKVIGVDLNPLSIFVTEMETTNTNIKNLNDIFEKIKKNVSDDIEKYYLTKCPKCKKQTTFHWMKFSYIFECPNCKKSVEIKDLKKHGSGKFECNHCKKIFQPITAKKVGEIPFEMEIRCQNCNFKGIKKIDEDDLKKIQEIERNFDKIITENKLWYPQDIFPDADRQRDDAIYQKGIKFFKDLFTKRNLISLSILFKEISNYKTKEGQLVLLSFSDTLGWTSKMSSEPGHGWQYHAYWLPYIFFECNVWDYFKKRFDVMLKAKEYSQIEIDSFYEKATNFEDLKDKTCLFLTQSSHELPIPEEKVDVIITDPPYGGNVQYMELSDFYLVWIQKILKFDIFKDIMLEAVETRHEGFPTEKLPKHYKEMLYKIFKECHRVLKPNGWLVMTFHNKNFRIWNTIHSVVHDAGFVLSEEDGMIYQQPIKNYTQTLHTRSRGSMLGDFILSFKRVEFIPKIKMIEEVEIGAKIKKITAETIQYHGGAKISTIYMRLVPFLLNNGLLHKVNEKDITKYLKQDFEEKEGKWYFKENVFEVEGIKHLDYIPVEARIEFLMLSLFHEKKMATMDDILEAVFTNLINGNVAEYEEISRVLNKIAEKKDEKYWQLKELGSETQKQLSKFVERKDKLITKEKIDIVENRTSEESIHDLMIKNLVSLGKVQGYSSHIGQTEQRKYLEFRKISIPMGNNVEFGLNPKAFDIIREIDLLWLKGNSIVAAFEIEKSTTIDSGINRFRNLFAATPNQNIPTYIAIPDNREEEAINKIGSLANRKENLNKKIKYILFSDIKDKKIEIEKISKEIF